MKDEIRAKAPAWWDVGQVVEFADDPRMFYLAERDGEYGLFRVFDDRDGN